MLPKYCFAFVQPTLLHYILVSKFKDFQGPKVAFSRTNYRRKFTACTILQQYLIYIHTRDYGTVLVDKNKTWQLLANLGLGKIPGRLKDRVDVSGNPVCIHGFMDDIVFAQNWPSKGDVRTYTQ